MGDVWSCNDDQINFFILQESRSVRHDLYPRVTLASLIRVAFYNFLQSKIRNRLNDRRMEGTTRHAITNQTHAHLIWHSASDNMVSRIMLCMEDAERLASAGPLAVLADICETRSRSLLNALVRGRHDSYIQFRLTYRFSNSAL